ncbi:MAG: hypothetical protein CMP64_00255 [Flavobacteriales bacterium]|nr:hypothetical protein [Flavobacteriales bacterium]|tara:strand:+ start:4024 stop:6480 length:2457 start_codon:yes stop_codon:yes gene_type:complete
MKNKKKEIDFALVEATRPPIYTALKYWGKKPHNIWNTYIQNYTPKDGLYLDPFCGSGISIFEAVKSNRKAIGLDLNPLTSFIFQVYTSKFELNKFREAVSQILNEIKKDDKFLKFFSTNSRKTNEKAIIQSFKWEGDTLYELGINFTDKEINTITKGKQTRKKFRYLAEPNLHDHKIAKEQSKIKITTWYPDEPFIKSPSFNENFINCIGGNNFSNLWTKRNLYVLSNIFELISKVKEKDLQLQLLFGFMQTLHLTTKMSVPRRKAANRPFSTSWGRSAYICANRKMEMNPLFVFESSCFGKQSVESALSKAKQYLGKNPKILQVSESNKHKNKLSGFDIKYGTIDINTITDYIPEKSIDFIMTDPPYGGLVQYLDLSSIWLNWLKKIDSKFIPNYNAEITIKKDIIDIKLYQKRFTSALKNLNKLLKDNGKIVFTFHNKEINIWNAFLKSITLSGLKIEKVIHQQNRRTGEANVANPYGTSGTDFYIRCIKSPSINLKTELDQFEHFVVNKAIEIIASRNEPTPFLFLFNGLLTEISSAGFDLEDFDKNIQQILKKKIGNIFTLTNNHVNNAGQFWWFLKPEKHIKYRDKKLADRVEETIISILRRKNTITLDDALAEIFQKYPNGLTPDVKSITSVLKKYATKSSGRWLYNYIEVEREFTKHTEIIYKLIKFGQKLNFRTYVGKREQPEPIKNKKLSDFCDIKSLDKFIKHPSIRKRVEMIDLIWLKDNEIKFAIEVENSTNFMSGIQRASNLSTEIPKLMIIPDHRKKELERISDPLFITSFKNYNWKYITYSDIERIIKTPSMEKIKLFSFNLS